MEGESGSAAKRRKRRGLQRLKHEESNMKIARLFTIGRSQAVRLPKECRFAGKEVYVRKLEGIVILIPKDDPWASLVSSLGQFSEDFLADRNQPPVQTRKGL